MWEMLDDDLEVFDNDISFLPQHNSGFKGSLVIHLCLRFCHPLAAVPWSPGRDPTYPCLFGMPWSGLGPSLRWMNFWLG